MPALKRIVCLANSRKHAGRCIAGKAFPAPGKWLRPIGAGQGAELSDAVRRYKDGTFPQLLDVIDIPVLAALPNSFQTENIAIDSTRCWAKAGTFAQSAVNKLLDPPAPLWIAGETTDRVSVERAADFSDSLRLIQVDAVTISVRTENVARWQVRAEFDYLGTSYNLSVTDLEVEQSAFTDPDAKTMLTKSFLTVSLGEPFHNYCYKLVAAILPPFHL